MNTRILVLGCGDVGSAIAHQLFVAGADVVLADVAAPAHPRRGMAFTDAWFDGTATLEGVVAQFVPDAAALDGQTETLDAVLASALPAAAGAAAWRAQVLVDARMRKREAPEDLRPLAPTVLGLGPGFEPGRNCHLAVETAWGDRLGAVLADRPASALGGEPRALDGVGRERFVYATAAGRWRTPLRIGAAVQAGTPVGSLGGQPVCAPLAGHLRGLTHDGVEVRVGQKIVEVDPRPVPDTQGLGIRPAAIARGVARALALATPLESAFFGFEREYLRGLECMPMSLRHKLDRCGVKLSLAQWRALSRPLRELLLVTPVPAGAGCARMARWLHRWAERQGWGRLPPCPAGLADDGRDAVPETVARQCVAHGVDVPDAVAWAALARLQRYALARLSEGRGHRNWWQAWREFGLIVA